MWLKYTFLGLTPDLLNQNLAEAGSAQGSAGFTDSPGDSYSQLGLKTIILMTQHCYISVNFSPPAQSSFCGFCISREPSKEATTPLLGGLSYLLFI